MQHDVYSLFRRVLARAGGRFSRCSPVAMMSGTLLCAAFAVAHPAWSATPPAATASFSLVAQSSIRLEQGGRAQAIVVSAQAGPGFTDDIALSITGLPAGVVANPSHVTLAPGRRETINLAAAKWAMQGTFNAEISGSSGELARSSALKIEVAPAASTTTNVTLSTLSFDFGNNLVGNKLIQHVVVVTNSGTATLTMSPSLSGDPSFSIATSDSCGASLAPGKTCDVYMRYQPTKASYPKQQTTTLKMNFGNAYPGVPNSVLVTGTSAALMPGVVTATDNPQVALYTMTLPFPGRMKVEFGPTTTYSRNTWYQSTDVHDGQISTFVAGMLPNTTYHMSALVELSNGIIVRDTDHTFKTGTLPVGLALKWTATTTAGMTPSPGIELTNPLRGLEAVDLQGNVIWWYNAPPVANETVNGVKQLPNGDILVVMGLLSSAVLTNPVPESLVNEVKEINLAGDTVREISIDDLNASLAGASCAECGGGNLTLLTFHHDVTPLPNGHWLLLANAIETLSATTKPPLTGGPTPVLGDVIVDVDENMQPVWVWNEFNHLDPNRHPYQFPDWTHTNAVLYSQDDGNLIVSMRHQNWIVKVNYHNGSGNGDILWHLGEGGDFKLVGGIDPTDWPYAQHDPGYFSPNTSGVFSLGIMDNGDDRLYPAGSTCTPQATLPGSCLYSSVPVFRIDEKAMTATLTFHQKLPGNIYNSFGGNAEELANGDVEFDLCGVGPIGSGSVVREVTQDSEGKTVWNLNVAGGNLYRAFRIPSLYPGVQW